MEKFTTLTAVAAPMPMQNIDTDKVIPARFLKTIKRSGLGVHLFDPLRFDSTGNERPEFILNQDGYRNSQVIIANENFGPVPSWYLVSAPSHGISLSPDGTELYVLDAPAREVQVWTTGDTPTHLATIKVSGLRGYDAFCHFDCVRSGWLLHSLDGRYVFVGDSGDVIDTTTRTVAGSIPALANDRHGFLEIDWSGGGPVATSSHFGTGR